MQAICFIHGGSHNPDVWRFVREELGSSDYATMAVDLPTDQPQATTNDYVAEIDRQIVQALGSSPEDLIVVAHSMSGVFLPLVGAAMAVTHRVFLAAVVPDIGRSAMEQSKTDDMFNPEWMDKDVSDLDTAQRFLFHDCPPERLAWARSTLRVFMPQRALDEKTPLTRWPAEPLTYIACSEDRMINPSWQLRVMKERLHCTPHWVQTSHSPHVSYPAEVSKALRQFVMAVA
jgi:pimeloyl-ACP methyl ester carboxylesterase